MINQYSVKDLKKALQHLEDKYKTVNVGLETDDMARLHLKITDISGNGVDITIYRSNDESCTKFPEITFTQRFTE